MKHPNCIPPEKWLLLGIPVLFIVGGFMHFAYDLSGQNVLVGIIAPVNESIWEHLKLAFYPMLVWWFGWYAKCGRQYGVTANVWFTAAAAAITTCPIVITTFYYTYTGALGIHSAILDIFSLLLGLAVAQILGLHIYNYANLSAKTTSAAIAIIIIMAVAFTVFTFNPPHIPLFMDSQTGTYGIQ